MALPAFLARLLIHTGAWRLFPSLQRRLAGEAESLRWWSARLLEAPFDELGQAEACLAQDGPDAIDLGAGAPTFDLGTGNPRLPADQRGLPPAAGLPSLRGAVAARLLEEGGSYSPAEEILVTPGAMGAVHTVLDAFVDRRDAVVVPDPVSPLFPLVLKGRGARLRPVPARNEDGVLRLRLDKLAHALRGAKLLVLCSPCNPTGGAYPPDELEQIAWWAERRDVLILSDESFSGLCHDDGHTPTAAFARRRTLMAGGVSKGHGMAWARVGWLAGPKHLMTACRAAAALRGPFVPATSQLAALAALQGDDAREGARQRLGARRGYVLDRLRGMGLEASWPAAGCFAWAAVPAGYRDGLAFAEALRTGCRVRVVPGSLCGAAGAQRVRISFGGDEGRLEEGLNRMAGFLRQGRILSPMAVAV